MFKRILSLILGALVAAGVNITEVPPQRALPEADAVPITDLSAFQSALWKQSAAGAEGKNALISPLSAWYAMAMTANGARGETLAAFGLTEADLKGLNADAKALTEKLSKLDLTFHSANSIWCDTRFKPSDAYEKTLADAFAAESFRCPLSKSTKKVNSWIEEKTEGLIKDMLRKLDPDTVMLLINAVYLDAKFKTPFAANKTKPGRFLAADGSAVEAAFMNRTQVETKLETDGLVGVSIPYAGGMSLVVMMPKDETKSTADAVSMLADADLPKLLADGEETLLSLSLPRFEVESTGSLKEMLSGMGLSVIFTGAADFTGIDPDGGLFVDDVLQNAKLRTNETGTEAAAATVVIFTKSMPRPDPEAEKLVFDRPFVFAVVEPETGAMLFCGQVNDPSADN